MMINKDGELEGYSIDLIAKIAEMLSFRYEVYLSPDGLYGGWNEKTGFTGIVGEITKSVSIKYVYALAKAPFKRHNIVVQEGGKEGGGERLDHVSRKIKWSFHGSRKI